MGKVIWSLAAFNIPLISQGTNFSLPLSYTAQTSRGSRNRPILQEIVRCMLEKGADVPSVSPDSISGRRVSITWCRRQYQSAADPTANRRQVTVRERVKASKSASRYSQHHPFRILYSTVFHACGASREAKFWSWRWARRRQVFVFSKLQGTCRRRSWDHDFGRTMPSRLAASWCFIISIY